ncbi:MAG: type II toxin-antitoxin system RelE/ParE family toxin [Candidatus Marinimicrobia bacterium]|nr:type II toxin-antitoxin system RelE/ParE family toxin [Candidatus Neomarinimicrobiota bacterium]
MKIIWSYRAKQDLINIQNYIAMDNPEKAFEFVDLIVNKTEYLFDNPRMGRIVPEYSDPDFREIIIKNYRLLYKIVKDEIQILTVFEGRRLVKHGLREFSK